MGFKQSIYRLIMKTCGQHSKGIQIAQEYGLNSAELMDYVYSRNLTPQGDTFLGRWADSLFINFPTWISIRKRKQNLQNTMLLLLKGMLKELSGKNIRVLDLASGYGHYIFSVLDKLGEDASRIYVEMRDNNFECEKHINLLNKKGYNVKFVLSDIMDETSYDTENKFDLIILAGFYESVDVHDIKTIEHIMGLVKSIMHDDSLFLFSYQATHVDSSLVNALFRDSNNAPLFMGERNNTDMQYFIKRNELTFHGQISDDENRYPLVLVSKQGSDRVYIKNIFVNK